MQALQPWGFFAYTLTRRDSQTDRQTDIQRRDINRSVTREYGSVKATNSATAETSAWEKMTSQSLHRAVQLWGFLDYA